MLAQRLVIRQEATLLRAITVWQIEVPHPLSGHAQMYTVRELDSRCIERFLLIALDLNLALDMHVFEGFG